MSLSWFEPPMSVKIRPLLNGSWFRPANGSLKVVETGFKVSWFSLIFWLSWNLRNFFFLRHLTQKFFPKFFNFRQKKRRRRRRRFNSIKLLRSSFRSDWIEISTFEWDNISPWWQHPYLMMDCCVLRSHKIISYNAKQAIFLIAAF